MMRRISNDVGDWWRWEMRRGLCQIIFGKMVATIMNAITIVLAHVFVLYCIVLGCAVLGFVVAIYEFNIVLHASSHRLADIFFGGQIGFVLFGNLFYIYLPKKHTQFKSNKSSVLH